MKSWGPKDVIALAVVVLAGSLLHQGIDTVVGWSLLGIVAGYYGIDLTPWLKVGRVQKKPKEE